MVPLCLTSVSVPRAVDYPHHPESLVLAFVSISPEDIFHRQAISASSRTQSEVIHGFTEIYPIRTCLRPLLPRGKTWRGYAPLLPFPS